MHYMIKGIDYTGVTVSFFCHDGEGNFVMHKRGAAARDEQGTWDFGGGGVKFNESLEDCLRREIQEEYGVILTSFEYLGFDEKFREHEGVPTHWIGFRYLVLVDRDKVHNAEPDKHDELGWFTLDSLPSPRHSLADKDLEKYKEALS